MTIAASIVAFISLAIWFYLLAARHFFWRTDQRLSSVTVNEQNAAHVVVLVPARNEEDSVGECLASLITQKYPGDLDIVLIDDSSTDNTGAIAENIAATSQGTGPKIHIVKAAPLQPGWTGKLWALQQGLDYAEKNIPGTKCLWLTDADILHKPEVLAKLVKKLQTDRLALVSEMVCLNSSSRWEKFLIPAFVFFFRKLYPFRAVNNSKNRTAGAAGGSILLQRDIFVQAGGFGSVKNELIDDCAIAGLIKKEGHAIWLGHGLESLSIRPYRKLSDIWRMVARTAYHQLNYSPLKLIGVIFGMILTYLIPPVIILTWPLHGSNPALIFGLLTWILMAGLYAPTLRLYRQNPLAGLLLPFSALLYTAMTLSSAIRHWRGKGGQWKERVHENLPNGHQLQ